MNNKMPEKIWIDDVYWYPSADDKSADDKRAGGNELVEYTRTDTIPDVAELQRQNAALKAFVKKVVELVYKQNWMDDFEVGRIAKECRVLNEKYEFPDWLTEDTAKMPVPSPKITIVRWNPKGYWEALSDGSKAFLGYDESAEEEYEGDVDKLTQDEMFEQFWSIVPAGKWQAQIDFTVDEIVKDYEEQGYQVFVIPEPISKVEVAREFVEICFKNSAYPFRDMQSVMLKILKEWEAQDAENNSH